MAAPKTVLVTGGAGYVGAVLVPELLQRGYRVRVLDLYLYGEHVLDPVARHGGLEQITGDIRDVGLLKRILPGCDAVIHLACISNDPSFELNPELGKSINFDAFGPLVEIARDSGVSRFVYASSSSVYGVKQIENVTEDLRLEPLTDYSKYKAMCEDVLQQKRGHGFETLTLRPATVCGYSPRLRLDLTVNILTNHAFCNRVIKVFGGDQMRPNIHIRDMADAYVQSLEWPAGLVDGHVFNVGYHNYRVRQIADIVRGVVGPDVAIATSPTDDNRSYHVSSARIRRVVGFEATRTIDDAVRDLVTAFRAGQVPDSMDNARYYNIRTMQALRLR